MAYVARRTRQEGAAMVSGLRGEDRSDRRGYAPGGQRKANGGRKPQQVPQDVTFRIDRVWYRVRAVALSQKFWIYEAFVRDGSGWRLLKRPEKHHWEAHYPAVHQGKRWVRSYHVAQAGRRRG
jgi:hypothetical protein